MKYWSEELKADSFSNPEQILDEVGKELTDNVSKLGYEVVCTTSDEVMVWGLEFTNNGTSNRARIVEVIHSINLSYPCAILTPKIQLPKEVKRRHVIAAKKSAIEQLTDIRMPMFESTPEKVVENEWICSTPSELRTRMKDALSLDVTKGMVIRLLSGPPSKVEKPN